MACNCKNCKDVTLFKGSDGVGVQHIEFNGCPTACDGTFTIFLTDGTTYTSPDLTGAAGADGADGVPFKFVFETAFTDGDPLITIPYATITNCGDVPAPTCIAPETIANNFVDYTITVWREITAPAPSGDWQEATHLSIITVNSTTGALRIDPNLGSAVSANIRIVIIG